MAQSFEYISSATQSGIVKLKSLEMAWNSDTAAISVGASGGKMCGAVGQLAASLRTLDQDMGQLISSTIAYLQKIDSRFNEVDEAAAAALLGAAEASAAMNNVFANATAVVASGDGAKGKKTSLFPTLGQFLLGGFKLKGAVGQAEVSGAGKVLGFNASGKLAGEALSGSISTKSGAKWDITKGEVGAEAEMEAKGSLLHGSASGKIGIVSGEVEAGIGNAAVSGKVGATLYKDGKIAPSIGAKAEAKATAVEGSVGAQVGTDDFNGHAKASGAVGVAKAEAGVQAGVVEYKDEVTGEKKTAFGASAKVGAEAYAAEGKVSGGFTLFGVKIDASLKGKAGGAGVSAGGSVTTGGVSGEIGAGLGLGAGISINIDWSNFHLW